MADRLGEVGKARAFLARPTGESVVRVWDPRNAPFTEAPRRIDRAVQDLRGAKRPRAIERGPFVPSGIGCVPRAFGRTRAFGSVKKLEPEFIPTDRILKRWAVACGSWLKNEEADEIRASQVPPLDDDSAVIVEEIVNRAAIVHRRLVVKWYRTQTPSESIAQQMQISERGLYQHWRITLNYFRWQIEASRHDTLIRILHARVAD